MIARPGQALPSGMQGRSLRKNVVESSAELQQVEDARGRRDPQLAFLGADADRGQLRCHLREFAGGGAVRARARRVYRAHSDRPGLFEAANGGTIFLDEVGEVSPGMPVKLLRVMQSRELRRWVASPTA
jgi:hypothetical protein